MTSEDKSQNQIDSEYLADLISLGDASKVCGLSPSHLRLLVTQGEIWGVKIGRNWLTSRQAVTMYCEANHKPGPKPAK